MTRTGRPAIGEQISVSMPLDLLAQIDRMAKAAGISRSGWIRRACVDQLTITITRKGKS